MVRLGLYGCGNRTAALLRSLSLDGLYTVSGLYDLNAGAAENLQRQYGGRVCRTPDELIELKDVDAFLISLSPFAHAEALRQSFRAGKPIFVEKPISFSAAEVRELAETASRLRIPVQVGFMRRYCAWNLAALDYMKRNDPGHLFSVSCNWFHAGETEMLRCLKQCPDNFRLKVSQIPFHCCHALDVMLLFGGPVKRVTSRMVKVIDRPYPSPDDLVSVLEFDCGAIGEFHYSSMSYLPFEISYRIHAENYSMKINFDLAISRRPSFQTSRGDMIDEGVEHYFLHTCAEKRSYASRESVTSELIMHDFIRMVEHHTAPSADLTAAWQVAQLAEAIETSGRTGKTIELDLPEDKELIHG